MLPRGKPIGKGGIISPRRKKRRTNQVEESPGELVATRGPARRKIVALDDVDVLALALVEAVVLATDGAHLERIAEQLASFLKTESKSCSIALRHCCTLVCLVPRKTTGKIFDNRDILA